MLNPPIVFFLYSKFQFPNNNNNNRKKVKERTKKNTKVENSLPNLQNLIKTRGVETTCNSKLYTNKVQRDTL